MQGRLFIIPHSQPGRKVVVLGNKIFEGAKLVDLPIEQPTKFQLVGNLKTAKALAIEMPPSLLGMATG